MGYNLRRLAMLMLAGLALAIGMAVTKAPNGYASATDCNANSIINCGTTSASQFIATVRSNDSGNGHHDLQAVYAAYGLEPAGYDRFVSSARPGTAYKDGRIVVDGQVVATNAKSIGREKSFQGSNPFSKVIGGTTYWGNSNSQAFSSNSIPVMVLFDSKGMMQFAVLTSCGNPTSGTNVTPKFSCDALHKQVVSAR